jgi:streptogramin lyase
MPVPAVPDSRRFAKHLTGIIHSELMEIPGVASQEMRLVRHDPLTDAGPTTCAEIDVASVSGSRARIVVYPLPPDNARMADEQLEARDIIPDIDVDVESLG